MNKNDTDFVFVAPNAEARQHWAHTLPKERILVCGIAVQGQRISGAALLPGVDPYHLWIDQLRERMPVDAPVFAMYEV